MCYQCNGVVIDSNTNKVLSYPSPICKPIYNKTKLIAGLTKSKYEVYKVRDGTIVTLYWFDAENRWCMSTANGYDVGSYRWMGDHTYETAFATVCARYDGFSLDALDKTKCYTFGFRFHEFHLFTRDPECVWFVQCCDLAALNNDNQLNVVTAAAKPEDIPTEVAMFDMQESIKVNPKAAGEFFGQMIRESRNSINAAIRNGDGFSTHYGYIFRDPTCDGKNANIVIESDLMKAIRRMLYDFGAAKRDKRVVVNQHNRLNYILVKCFLSYNNRSTFIALMPQYEAQFDQYSKLTNQVIGKIITRLRSRGRGRSSNSLIDSTADALTSYATSGRVNTNDTNTRSIIHDKIVVPSLMFVWYNLFTKLK